MYSLFFFLIQKSKSINMLIKMTFEQVKLILSYLNI